MALGSILGALIAASLFLGFSNVITIYQNFIFDDGNIYELHQYNESLQRISGTETGGFSYMSSESMKAILAFVKLVGVVAMLKSIYLNMMQVEEMTLIRVFISKL